MVKGRTLKASTPGLTRIKQARERITQETGWAVNNEQWLLEAGKFLPPVRSGKNIVPGAVSIGTWKRFLTGKPIKPTNFRAFCQVLGLNWQEVVEGDTIAGFRGEKPPSQIAAPPHPPTGDSPLASPARAPRQDWGEAIDVSLFIGRTGELATLKKWIVDDGCRLVAFLGMGGTGKTSLSVKLAQQLQHEFEFVIWRSLQDAPPVSDTLATLLQFLSNRQQTDTDLPESTSQRITRLIDCLRRHRCLLVLDSAESIMQAGASAGQYLKGYDGYGELIKRVGETSHRSCLALTSCEKPQELALLEGETLPVRSLELTGLNEEEGRSIFQTKGAFAGTPDEWKEVIQHYAGHPLALKLVASATREVFGESLSELVKYLKSGGFPFSDIAQLLDRQFNRLTDSEKEALYWLAISREPISFAALQESLVCPASKHELLETLKSLKRKSLIETRRDAIFTLHPVVREYALARLISQICEEIETEKLAIFNSNALLQLQAKYRVRDTQTRLILQPVKDRLLNLLKGQSNVKAHLNQLLSKWRSKYPHTPGYTAGNILSLISLLNAD